MTQRAQLAELALPAGIRSRYTDHVNGLRMHFLEAGFRNPGPAVPASAARFPELAYCWRKVMPALASAGYHVVAPDQRGCGRTTGWDAGYDGDLRPFRLLNVVRDAIGLVPALGYRSVEAVVGHDFGSPAAARAAARSAPPRPAPGGECGQPLELNAWSAGELARMPEYYVMDLDKNMAETVAGHMPPAAADSAASSWLPDAELAQCVTEFGRTGFQGDLQSYRCSASGAFDSEMQIRSRQHWRRCVPGRAPSWLVPA